MGKCKQKPKASKRKAFALIMKKHHGFHKEDGGLLDKLFDNKTILKKK